MAIKTPYYLFDIKKFKKLIDEYKQIGDIFYPIKSNDDPLIIKMLINESCNFEVDSIEHIKLLVNEWKVHPNRLLYSYPILEQEDIILANELGIKKFVVDTEEEYQNICSVVENASFIVRLNSVNIIGTNLAISYNKWGMTIDGAKKLINKIYAEKHNVIGVSFYLFKEIVSSQSLKNMLHTISSEFRGYKLEYLNIGGGIAPSDIRKIYNELQDTQRAIGANNVIIEPGTPLLNPCIDMVVSVTAIRTINKHRFVFINAGIYRGLLDTIIKQRQFELFDNNKDENCEIIKTIVCGSSSDVSDYLGEYYLRSNLCVGDQLVIKECGAYSNVMQTYFYRKERIPMFCNSD